MISHQPIWLLKNPTPVLSRFCLLALILSTLTTRIFGQDFKEWRAEKNEKAVRFTARFLGLSGEKAVFENKTEKRAEIELKKLSHDSLVQLVIQLSPATPPVVTLPQSAANSSVNKTLNKPAWQRKIEKSFSRAVREIEELRADFYKDSDDWVKTKRQAKDREFQRALQLYKDQFSFECEILEIVNTGVGHIVTIKNDLIGEMKLNKFVQYGESRSIKSINVDKGTKATVYGLVSMSAEPRYSTNDFGLLNYGIEKNGRTYYLNIYKIRIE